MDVVPAEVLADTVDRRHVDRDLCALQLDGYLRRLARQEAVCRRVLGRLARTFLAGRSHHRLGFARLGDYTREPLSLSAREVQELARVAERLETLPTIAAAFAAPAPTAHRPRAQGPPDPSATPADAACSPVDVPVPEDVEKLLELGPWGDPFTLDERLRAARRAMQRIDWQMGVLLRTFFDLRLHRAFGFPSASRYVAERLGLSARKARALIALERGLRRTPVLAAAYRGGTVSWLRALTVLPVATTDDAWVARAGEVTLRRLVAEVEWALDRRDAGLPPAPPPPDATLAPVEWQMRAHHDETLDADITFAAPPSVVALFRGALDAFRPAGAPLWQGCEKVLEHVCGEWESQPRHRDPVFARDGWRCAVPACTSRANLHDHHVLYRSAGGDNSRENRVTVCAWHHLRGIHLGRIRAHGMAPHAIIWEIGLRRGRPPLMRTVGDRYLS